MPGHAPLHNATPENRRTLARNFLPDFNISAEMRLLMFMHGRVHTFESVCRKLEAEIANADEEHAMLVASCNKKQEDLTVIRTGKMHEMLPNDFTGPTVTELANGIAHGVARLKVLADLHTQKAAELKDTREMLAVKIEQCALADKRWSETKGRVRMRGDAEDAMIGGHP